MALQTYDLECPKCEEEFSVELAPEALAEGGELIECPNCFMEWEWEFDTATNTLELIDDSDDDEEEADALSLVEYEKDDDE